MASKNFMNKWMLEMRKYLIHGCMFANTVVLYSLPENYVWSVIGVQGPSMEPTLDRYDNLLLVLPFLRLRKDDVIVADNPFKPGYTMVKRIKHTEGEMA